jgi:hypothetical protein
MAGMGQTMIGNPLAPAATALPARIPTEDSVE